MGILDGLLGQPGVQATGGGIVYDPTKDYKETRFDDQGNAYQSSPDAPLIPGHTKQGAEPMFQTQNFEMPPVQSVHDYGANYYSGEPFTPQVTRPPEPKIDPMSLYNRQGRADYTPQNIVSDEVVMGKPPLGYYPNASERAEAEERWYQEQDKIEATYQALLKAQGIEQEKLEAEDDRILDQAQQDDFNQRVQDRLQHTPDWLGQASGPISDTKREDLNRYTDTDYFGNPLDTDSFGNTNYETNLNRKLDSMNRMAFSGGNTQEQAPTPQQASNTTDFFRDRAQASKKYQDAILNIGDTIGEGVSILYEGAKDLGSNIDLGGVGESISNIWGDVTKPDTRSQSERWSDAEKNIAQPLREGIKNLPNTVSDLYQDYFVPADKVVTQEMIDAYNKLKGGYDVLSKGTSDVVRAIPSAYSRGVGGMVKAGKTLGNVVMGEEYFDETDGEIHTPSKPDYNYPMVGEGAEIIGAYGGGMGAGVKLASKAPHLVKYLSSILGGTSTLDPTEGNLSAMIQDTDYRNALTEYLASSPDQEASSLEKLKFYGKTFMEDTLIGLPFDGAILGYQAIKNNPALKEKILEELGSFADDAETFVGKIPGVETEQTVVKNIVPTGVDARTDIDELGFYSEAENVVNKLKQETNHPDHIRQFMQKNGVTVDEMQETGILDYLQNARANDERVTKHGLLDHIKNNKTKLEETQYVGRSEGDELDNMSDYELDDPTVGDIEHSNANVFADPYYISSRAEDVASELSTADEFRMEEMFNILHKQNPQKYPKTIDMQIKDAERKINLTPLATRQLKEKLNKPINSLDESERRDILDFYKDNIGSINDRIVIGNGESRAMTIEDIVRKTKKHLDKVENEIIDLQNKRSTTDGYTDDWSGEISRKIDDGDLDDLGFDMTDMSEEIAKKEYLENPYYEWNTRSGYTATGSEDTGIIIKDPDGNPINMDDPAYSINEANIQINQHSSYHGYQSFSGDTKYSDYIQPGADKSTYREIPITARPLTYKEFTGGHFDEDNVVAHLRVSDRTDAEGNKVLFIEEMQSDWHQQGRKSGYFTRENEKLFNKLSKERRALRQQSEDLLQQRQAYQDKRYDELYDKVEQSFDTLPDGDLKTNFVTRKVNEIITDSDEYWNIETKRQEVERKFIKKSNELQRISNKGGTADAPLKDAKWQEMAFKRAIKIASDEGYDRVAWTNSQQQVDLYSPNYRELYENLYDKKLPGYAKKFAKQNQSQTGKVQMEFSPMTREVNYIDITPELKANVSKGQSMYGATSIAKPNNSAVAIPTTGLLMQEESQSEEMKDGILNNVKSWKPSDNLINFVKMMENAPLAVGNVGVTEYDDVGHQAKGYGTKSGLLAEDTEEEATKAMIKKLIEFNKDVDRLVKIKLNKDERNALVSLLYNIGDGNFAKSKALKALNKGDKKTFLKEAFDPKIGFVKSDGKVLKGLVNRRAREKQIFTKGNYGN